jgi:hypothetical protein
LGLREQARLDARAILEDTSGFAWPVILTSPLGVVTSLRGFTTDVGQSIDPETGQAVAGQRASFAVARAALPALPEAVAESDRKPWIATFADSEGAFTTWKVIEVLPDRAAGIVVMILEVFQRAIVHLTGALALPSGIALAGTITPAVELAGDLELPSGIALAGTITPAVELTGALALPMIEASGTFTVDVGEFGGALALPMVELAGEITPAVELAGDLELPSGIALAGDITPAVELAGALALPMVELAGEITPAVELAGSLALPMIQLAGDIAPAVELSGSIVLPMIQLSGTITPGESAIAAMLDFETATNTSGAWSSVPDLFASNPATQGTAAARPLVATSANGLPLADNQGGDDVLLWPVASNNNQTVTHGVGFWVQFDSVAAVNGLISAFPSSAANKYELFVQNGLIGFDAYTSQFAARRGALAGAVTTGVWYFVTVEYDGNASGDAGRCTITIDGTVLSLTFSNSAGTPPGSVMPATLISTTGNLFLGARSAAGLSSMNGRYGPKLYVFGSKLTGASPGLLTAAARAAIMAYKQPT